MSSRKTNKLNKPPKPHQQNSNNTNRNQHPGSQQPQQKKLASQSSFDAKESTASGLVISVHKAWPDLQLNQSRLFFECTLFLYSVLALFLQYLNLYRTLWWLPKSYWPYSLKYHLINPYLLSCIGLLLGVRVTKCFWDALGERVDYFCKGQGGWQLTCWKIFEFAIVKTPLTTICCTSFMFSFTRIYLEFGTKALGYFFAPLISYICLFHVAFINELTGVLTYILSPAISLFKNAEDKSPESNATLMERFSKLSASVFVGPQNLVDLESVVHLCSDVASRTREEAAILLADFELRCRYCVFTGLLTAYFAIFMPRALLPMRTASGHGQYMLIDDLWVVQLFAIVASTGCSLYITYLFPINYFDLLYRCVVHLGCWESIIVQQSPPTAAATTAAANSCQQQQLLGSQSNRHGKTPPAMQETADEAYNPSSNTPYEDGARVICSNGHCFQAKSHPHFGTISAEPGNQAHLRLYRLAKDPVRLVTNLCLFQAALVAFQFWLLLLTSDWQQIVTLVLLMFANYLLLTKMFKDRVVIGRIYNPSSEDLQLIKQLREEVEAKRAQLREQQLLLLHKHKQQQQQQQQQLQPQHRR